MWFPIQHQFIVEQSQHHFDMPHLRHCKISILPARLLFITIHQSALSLRNGYEVRILYNDKKIITS